MQQDSQSSASLQRSTADKKAMRDCAPDKRAIVTLAELYKHSSGLKLMIKSEGSYPSGFLCRKQVQDSGSDTEKHIFIKRHAADERNAVMKGYRADQVPLREL